MGHRGFGEELKTPQPHRRKQLEWSDHLPDIEHWVNVLTPQCIFYWGDLETRAPLEGLCVCVCVCVCVCACVRAETHAPLEGLRVCVRANKRKYSVGTLNNTVMERQLDSTCTVQSEPVGWFILCTGYRFYILLSCLA